MNIQIILESERLLFRPHLITDLDDYCAMEMDIDVRRYVGGSPRSREDAEKRFPKNQLQKMAADRLAYWATILKGENTYIGRCGLAPHFNPNSEPIPGEAALGYYIAPKYWGQGFATEAGRAFIDFGFNDLALTRIVASVEKGNDASVHVLQKLGFSLEYTEEGKRTFYHFTLPQAGNCRVFSTVPNG
jgi:[ribosomal protein S5]-alanine N-acetyltransferase